MADGGNELPAEVQQLAALVKAARFLFEHGTWPVVLLVLVYLQGDNFFTLLLTLLDKGVAHFWVFIGLVTVVVLMMALWRRAQQKNKRLNAQLRVLIDQNEELMLQYREPILIESKPPHSLPHPEPDTEKP